MADSKRYYWLRLQDDFFRAYRIKKLRRMAGGDTYVIIYLKMQLKAMKTDGVLTWNGYEDDFVVELAGDLDEEPDDVRVTLAYLLSCGLAETEDKTNFFLPYAVKNTGSETASTQRVRDFRARQKALHCNADVTDVKRIGNVEKEIDTRDREDTTPPTPPKGDDAPKLKPVVYPAGFMDFWEAYPKKVGKQAAAKSFAKAVKTVDLQTILNAVERQKHSAQWCRDGGQYIPNPATWLNQGRWDDEATEVQPQPMVNKTAEVEDDLDKLVRRLAGVKA